jgi:DNA-binding NtrC family response regulator
MVQIPAKVLVVDDEKDFVEMFSLRLKEAGQRIFVAHSGRKCLETLAANEHIDVVVLDIKMPGMDGIETLMEIKKRYPIIEVILLTGNGTIETAVEGMKLGAYDYLLKPADFDDFRSKLKGAFRRKEKQEERIRRAEQRSMMRKSGNVY